MKAENSKLRRLIREERAAMISIMSSELKQSDYRRWVGIVNDKIAKINTKIRSADYQRKYVNKGVV